MKSLQKSICRIALYAGLPLVAFAAPAAADIVTVSPIDSPVVFTGEIVEETSDLITIDTRYGRITLAKAETSCKGCAPQVLAQAN